MSNEEEYRMPVVRRMSDGQLVLDDPAALGMALAVGKHNCKRTLAQNAERVTHFARRLTEKNLSPKDAAIVLLNVDTRLGSLLADALMPGHDWQAFRDQGQIPFARGLAGREGLQELVDKIDETAGNKLRSLDGVAIIVMDFDVVEVFTLQDVQEGEL